MAKKERPCLPIGVCLAGVTHTDQDEGVLDDRFRMAKEAGVFDYVDRSPLPGQFDHYIKAIQKHDMPVRSTGYFYVLGRDEDLLTWHLSCGSLLGARTHNVQISTYDINGAPVTDEQVAEAYLRAFESGQKCNVDPCFEVHVNMWSEHLGRVNRVAELVEARGVKFNMTYDSSHVVFKVRFPEEQDVQNMRADIESGVLQIDPMQENSVCHLWVERGYVRLAHARAAAPGGPRNIAARHPDGRIGRGIQYPIIKPEPGQWHAEWSAEDLEPWKETMRILLREYATNPDSNLAQISCEFIPFPDYGQGAGYSIFDNNIACAIWLRETLNGYLNDD